MALSSCITPAAPEESPLEGELVSYVATHDHTPSQRAYSLRTGDGALQRLLFDGAAPRLPPRTKLRVWGARDDSAPGFRVTRYEAEATTVPRGGPRHAKKMGPILQETYAFVLVDVGGGLPITNGQAQTKVFGAGPDSNPSFAQYFATSSYGAMQVSGDIVGPFTYDLGSANWSGCAVGDMSAGISQLTNTLLPKIDKSYDHYMWYFGPGNGCDFGGISEEGTIADPAVHAWYANLLACGATEHEVGHNHGFFHENSMTCKNKSVFDDNPMANCTSHEYGFGGPNTLSVMGSACGHDTAYDKWYAGWLTGCNGVKVQSSGTFTLLPIESSCDGIQALKVPMPKSRKFASDQSGGAVDNLAYYYLELREPTGLDAWLKQPSVFVYVAEDVHAPSDSSTWDWVLDMDTSTLKTDGLTAGKTFTDPAGGVSFTVTDIDESHATVQITLPQGSGPATCIDGSALQPPGPSGCDLGGGGASAASSSAVSSSSGSGGSSSSDAGSSHGGGPNGAVTGTGGRDGDAGGAAPQTGDSGAPGQCGCRAVGEADTASYPALLGGALALGRIRRRRGGRNVARTRSSFWSR